METANIKAISDRRMSAEDLEIILGNLPLHIEGSKGVKIEARMGLGKIVYLTPYEGSVEYIIIDEVKFPNRQGCLLFEHDGVLYDFSFNPSPREGRAVNWFNYLCK